MKRQLFSMIALGLGCLVVTLLTGQQAPGQKKDGGSVVGKVWEVTVKKGMGGKDNPPLDLIPKRLRVSEFDLFGPAGKKLGHYAQAKPDQIRVTFSEGKLKGYTIDLSMSDRDPPTWKGFSEKKEGQEKLWFKFVFLKD